METALLFGGLRQTGINCAPGSKEAFVVNRSSSRHDGACDDGSANERVLHIECQVDRLEVLVGRLECLLVEDEEDGL